MIDWMEKARRLQDFYAGRLSADEAEALRRDLGWPALMPMNLSGAGMQDAWTRGLAANKAMFDAMTAAPGGLPDPARMGAAAMAMAAAAAPAMEAWRQAAAGTLRGFGGFESTAPEAPAAAPEAAPAAKPAPAAEIETWRQRLDALNQELQTAVATLRSLQEAPDADPAAVEATLKRLQELNAAATEAMQGYHAALAAEAAGQK
ncbi:hypothetical protein [uncultured Tistrella sp.]|uniref:hypothetical protein n=1 Tax=Tistrella mobilis TaxID=171437 RepID=UPI000C099969|nr:hypothetical protein [uncultured Tistrella sp.]MAM74850.1 hypothetical protein [Tistrella sp.]